MDDAIRAFVNTIVLIGMFVALMLPILAIPYLFIKMGSVAGKVQAKMSDFGKNKAKNSAPAKAWQQRKGLKDSARTARANRMLNSRAGRLSSRGLGKDSRSAYDRFQEAQNKKEVGEHVAVMRSKKASDLAKIAVDKGRTRNEREAAMQVIASQGHAEQLLQLKDHFDANPRDGVGQAAFTQVKADNFATIKKEAPTVVGKEYGKLSQEEVMGMSKEAFGQAISSGELTHAQFQEAYDNPRLEGARKGHHRDYMGDSAGTAAGTLPPALGPI